MEKAESYIQYNKGGHPIDSTHEVMNEERFGEILHR